MGLLNPSFRKVLNLNAINEPDTTLKSYRLINILLNDNGYITKLDYQAGDYVQAGETLVEISDLNSLAFLLDFPADLKEFLPINKNVTLTLPDGQKLAGTITRPMSTVDQGSQIQNYVIKVYPVSSIPGDLIAKVAFVKNQQKSAYRFPERPL
jgi:multidrug efflux pump subunit AcrA (membrane-fusion protein)